MKVVRKYELSPTASRVLPLVVAVNPLPDESLLSLLVRAGEANVFERPGHLLRLANVETLVPAFTPFTAVSAATDLSVLLGVEQPQILLRTHSRIEDASGRDCVDWYGTPIERRHLEARVRRVSPAWLREYRSHRADWMVRLLGFCPRTLEGLVSQCPACGKPLGWTACRAVWRCDKCAASLLEAPATTVSHQYISAARLAGALVSTSPDDRQAALASLPAPFNEWRPGDALLALRTLGEARVELQGNGAKQEPDRSAQQLAEGLTFVLDWPTSLVEFVMAATGKSGSTSTRRGLGTLGKLFETVATPTPLRDLVRSSISNAFSEAAVPVKLWSGALIDRTSRTGKLSTLEAERRLGVSRAFLRRLEGRSATFLGRQETKGGTALYDETRIDRLADILAGSVRSDECARLLGVPRYCVPFLQQAGLVELERDSDAAILTEAVLFKRSSIARITAQMLPAISPLDDGVTLGQMMRRRVHPDDWVRVLAAVASGSVSSTIIADSTLPVCTTIIVSPAEVYDRCFNNRPEQKIPDITISCQVAADLIGATQQFISAAAKSGYLAGQVGPRNSALTLAGVRDFLRLYVLPDELGELLGEAKFGAGLRLQRDHVTPAVIINRCRVWLRSDVECWLQSQPEPYQS